MLVAAGSARKGAYEAHHGSFSRPSQTGGFERFGANLGDAQESAALGAIQRHGSSRGTDVASPPTNVGERVASW
jgi:hypothetical protein